VVSAVLANLATNLDDPGERLRIIHESMNGNKTVLGQLPRGHASNPNTSRRPSAATPVAITTVAIRRTARFGQRFCGR
jgi:hypothetical protein